MRRGGAFLADPGLQGGDYRRGCQTRTSHTLVTPEGVGGFWMGSWVCGPAWACEAWVPWVLALQIVKNTVNNKLFCTA